MVSITKVETFFFFAQYIKHTSQSLVVDDKRTDPIDFGVKSQVQILHSVYKALWTQYRLQFFVQSFSNFTRMFWMMRGGTFFYFWSWDQRSRSNLALSIKHC